MAYANSAPMPVGGQPVRFAQIDLPILTDPRLSEVDKTIYGILAAHRNAKHGKAWPKRATIAKLAGVHVETVTKSTTKLVACGYLVKSEGRGRGCTVVYTFPLADARDAQRRATQTQAKPEPKQPRKPRAERKAEREKTSPPAGFCAVHSSIGRTDVLEKEFTTLPSSLPVGQSEPEAVRGEFLATHATDLESVPVEVAAQATEQPTTVPVQPHTAPYSPERSSTATPTPPKARLSLPSGLKGKPLGIITRMLCGLPFDDAQMLLDELAGNMRRHEVKNPIGYMRRLLELYRAGKLIPELADIEQNRRRQIEANERSQQIIEQRHLAALAQGHLPTPPPIPTKGRTEGEKARIAEHIRQAKLAARGALFTEEQAEAQRQEYLAAKGLGPKPAAEPPPPRGEGYAKFKAEMERFRAGRNS